MLCVARACGGLSSRDWMEFASESLGCGVESAGLLAADRVDGAFIDVRLDPRIARLHARHSWSIDQFGDWTHVESLDAEFIEFFVGSNAVGTDSGFAISCATDCVWFALDYPAEVSRSLRGVVKA